MVNVGNDREIADFGEVHGLPDSIRGACGQGSAPPAAQDTDRAGWGAGLPPLAFPTVANIKSQKKRIITNAKRADRNKAVKSELRTRVKNAEQAAGTADADVSLRLAVKRLDMAASKGIIHPNAAARRKSRLMKKLAAK